MTAKTYPVKFYIYDVCHKHPPSLFCGRPFTRVGVD